MTNKITKAILLMTMLLAGTAYAVPPTNDSFANALTISPASGGVTSSNVDATREASEPIHAFNRGGRSVWFKYTAPGNGSLRLTTTQSTFNTLLAVYTGTAPGNLKLVGYNDDVAPLNTFSIVTIGTELGRVYYIAIDGYYDELSGPGEGTIDLDWSFTNAPTSDSFATPRGLASYSRIQSLETNVGATKQPGEPNHANNAGGKSVWYKWKANLFASNRTYIFSTKGSVRTFDGAPMRTLLAVYKGSSVDNLTLVGQASGLSSQVMLTPTPGEEFMIAVDGYNAGQGAEAGTINFMVSLTDGTKDADFDFDGRADISVYRPADGTWYTLDSITGVMRAARWGAATDRPILGRYDDDDKLDYAVFRPGTSTWWTYGSAVGSSAALWGLASDIAFNFRGEGPDNRAVFRPSTGYWYVHIGTGWGGRFGQEGDIPVPADYNGDGSDDIAIFRPSTGTWWMLNSDTGEQTPIPFGQQGDKPVPADYDGDGRADAAVFRPSDGRWYVRRSSNGGVTTMQWGIAGDIPQPADYDGDTRADFTVFRPSDGMWYVLRTVDGTARFIKFGQSGDIPVTWMGVAE